ncbi:hypothetical protein EDC17_10031 [Sphingobacterium alimentarium]|uniref:Uncharacterized protein n=1 Tax=Sphingobacterium alimentarium TaxID=797292 RepID=A0A4R3W0V5_9SPHI|nr:hypothetical protein EDC17_10031 [Sphingobacterium alimentarium]
MISSFCFYGGVGLLDMTLTRAIYTEVIVG